MTKQDWKQILYCIYTPDIGSLWGVPNGQWTNSFATNKTGGGFHPGLVGMIDAPNKSCRLVPGTSKDYRNGTCVYKVKINPTDPKCQNSYFLIDLWMTYLNGELYKLKRGWDGVDNLSPDQLQDFIRQIKFCRGIDV